MGRVVSDLAVGEYSGPSRREELVHDLVGGWDGDDVIVNGKGMISRSITEPGVYASNFPIEPVRNWNRLVAKVRRLDKLIERVGKLEKDSK